MDKKNIHDLKVIKNGPNRSIVPMTHGYIEGMGLRAELTPGGGDWILVCASTILIIECMLTLVLQLDTSTNVAHLDVRTQARTADGESLYIHYTGILKVDEAAGKILSWAKDAKTTNYGDHQWFSGPIIETSSEKFKWVETSLFVGEGRFIVEDGGAKEAIEYEIYRVVN